MTARLPLALILLVSLAHALVHVYEIALPSVEQNIAADYYGTDSAAGKQLTGSLSTAWRLMGGLGALIAGWLVDRFGSRRMLAIFLLGCALTCVSAATSSSQSSLLGAMILMGALASIYHPAGLALISHETSAENLPRALGIHGIFGSLGIGITPFLAGAMLTSGCTWRQFYCVLMVPGVILGAVFVRQAMRHGEGRATAAPGDKAADQRLNWRSFFTLTVMAALQGFVYSALMAFLPRYLSVLEWAESSEEVLGTFLASGVLLLGCFGQYLAGRFARPALLERQLTGVLFANAPLLLWMALATGWDRAVSAGLLALVHFMHQPLYNSLIAKYTPRHRRSLCYGFSFSMGLGLGSFGALFAGGSESDVFVYGTLSMVAAAGGVIGLLLCAFNPR